MEKQEYQPAMTPEEILAQPAITDEEKDFLGDKIGRIYKIYYMINENNSTLDIPEICQRLNIGGSEAAAYSQAMVLIGLLQVEPSLVNGVGGRAIRRNHFKKTFSVT